MIPDLRAPFFRKPWVRVTNAGGILIPPHSVVVKSGDPDYSSGEPVYPVIRPHSSSTQFMFDGYLVNGPWAIPARSGAEGVATALVEGGFVAYSGSTPTFGSVYGPKHGQFTLEQYYYGFSITGGATTSAGVNVVSARWIGIPSVLCKTADQITKGGPPVTCVVWAGAANAEAATGMEITGVASPFFPVGSSSFVWVATNGGIPYITQSAKTLHTSISNFRVKTGDTHVEAEGRDIYVDTIDSLAYSDKIELDDC